MTSTTVAASAWSEVPDSDLFPFRVAFDPDAIDDLRSRLRNTRWPERETVDDWSQGIPLAFVQDLAAYWCDEYDFAAAEDRMNAWPQFITRIDDLDIHFVHARSPEPDAMPLVITHGWPGSVVEFFDVLGPLDRSGRPRRRRRPTPSMLFARRCRATASATGRPRAAAGSRGSRRPGRR